MNRALKRQAADLKLSWNMIKEMYDGQWVELVEFQWDWDRPFPSWAKIRHSSSDRSELLATLKNDVQIEDSIVLYIGGARAVVGHENVASL